MLTAQKTAKVQYDKNSKEPNFKIGDKVLLQNQTVKKHQSKKFQQKFIGPYHIIQQGPSYTYKLNKISDGSDVKALINANRLKPYHDPINRDSLGLRNSSATESRQLGDNPSQQAQTQNGTNTHVDTEDSVNQWIPAEKILATKIKYGQRMYRVKFIDDNIPPEWIKTQDISDALKTAYHAKFTQTGKLRKDIRKGKVVFK